MGRCGVTERFALRFDSTLLCFAPTTPPRHHPTANRTNPLY